MQLNLPEQLWDLRAAFRAQGHDLRIVGGTVRDSLLGLIPKDVDLHTDATPEECVKIYDSHNVKWVPTGLDHGTVTVVFDLVGYEITSLREDVATDGRRAVVKYTRDWLVDAARRDFTMNSMSMSLEGELLDPFGGQADLMAGRVIFVGDARLRIQEDYLRILRWFRFRGRFGMHIMDSYPHIIRAWASGLKRISRERVWSEISRIVAGPHGPDLLEEITQMQVSKWIDLPDVLFTSPSQDLLAVTQNPITHLVWNYGLEAVDILRRWKASSADIKLAQNLSWAVLQHTPVDPFYALAVLGWNLETARELAALRGFDCFQIAVLEAWEVPVLPVNGKDLIAAGMRPGPELGRMLERIKNAWSQSGYAANKQQLMCLVS